MAIIYTYPTLSSASSADLILLTKASTKATSQITVDNLKDSLGVIDTITATSPIQVSLGNHSAALSLTTVPTSLGGTGLTTIGSAGQFLVVNSAGNGLEYIDETFIDGSGTTNYLPIFTDSDTLGDSTMYQSGSGDLVIQQYIQHDGDIGSKFGFNANDGFIVYLGGTGATERLQLQPDSFLVRTGDSTKINANATNASLYYEPSTSTDSHIVLTSTIDGALLKGEINVNPGKLRLYSSAQNSYVGLRGPTDPLSVTYNLQMPNDVGTIGQVLKLGTVGPTTELEWGDGLPNQSGQAGNFLKTDGTTATWAAAAGGGNITGAGTANQLALFSGASAIDGDGALTSPNLGQLNVGRESSNTAGKIVIENEPNVKGGTIQLWGKANSGINSKYVVLNASESASATAYNIYFPPTVPSSNNQVLKSVGTTGELQWADDNTSSIGGTIAATQIPVGTATDTIGDSIMSQQIATSNPTHYRLRISSPSVSATPSTTFPSLQLYNGNTGSWAQGGTISEITTYSADPSQDPNSPHTCSFIKTVQGQPGTQTATDGELVFGTALYAKPTGALESLRIDRDGQLLVTQSGTAASNDYRAGNVSLQKTGEFRLYGNTPFTGSNYHSIRNNNGALEIGDQSGFSGTINFFVDQASALEINDSAESTFKGGVTLIAGTAASPSINFTGGGTNTGFYSSAQNVVDVSINGQQKVSFTNSGVDFKTGITAEDEVTFQKRAKLAILSQNNEGDTIVSFDVRNGNTFSTVIDSNVTLNFGNRYQSGDVFWLHVTRTATPAVISWDNIIEWPGNVSPGQSSGDTTKADIYQFNVIGSKIYGSIIGVGYDT